jgi:hypothetical protein
LALRRLPLVLVLVLVLVVIQGRSLMQLFLV